MPLNIVVNDKFTISSDSRNYILQETAISQKGKSKGKKIILEQTYYHSIGLLLESITDYTIKTSNATTFLEIKAILVDLKRLYGKFYDELKGGEL